MYKSEIYLNRTLALISSQSDSSRYDNNNYNYYIYYSAVGET